jgi:hypothetical protein
MILPDVNVLVHAHNADSALHDRARLWWDACLSGTEGIGFAWAAMLGFVRLTTNRRVVARPFPIEHVMDQLQAWLTLPHVHIAQPVWGVHEVGGRWGIVFDRINGGSFAERMKGDPSVIPECLQTLAQLHARIHAHSARQLGSLKLRLATNIAGSELLDEPLRQTLLGCLADMPEGDRLCHGDFHPINVLGQKALPMVIDWPDACCGDPAADVCRSYLLLKLHAADIAEPYLEAYCNITNMPRASIIDWLPYVAAAGWPRTFPMIWHVC